jgi:hypothetical protein
MIPRRIVSRIQIEREDCTEGPDISEPGVPAADGGIAEGIEVPESEAEAEETPIDPREELES